MLPGHRYVSGAEEKVRRAFSAPSTFLANLGLITGEEVGGGQGGAQGASTPSLGLSNKAVYAGQADTRPEDKHVKDQFPDHYFTPEDHKLYGHGYEVFCVAASPCGSLVASACRSQEA